jgi:TonB family protein
MAATAYAGCKAIEKRQESTSEAPSQGMSAHPDAQPAASTQASIGGQLSQEQIQSVVRRGNAKLRKCYEIALARSPQLQGKVVASFTINTDGRVTALDTSESTLGSPEAVRCVAAIFSTMQFPKPQGGEVTVKYPVEFNPS